MRLGNSGSFFKRIYYWSFRWIILIRSWCGFTQIWEVNWYLFKFVDISRTLGREYAYVGSYQLVRILHYIPSSVEADWAHWYGHELNIQQDKWFMNCRNLDGILWNFARNKSVCELINDKSDLRFRISKNKQISCTTHYLFNESESKHKHKQQ